MITISHHHKVDSVHDFWEFFCCSFLETSKYFDKKTGKFEKIYSKQKSDAVYNMLKKMKSNNIPIDGIGLQMHIQENFNDFDGVKQNMQRLADLGLFVFCSGKNSEL